MKNARRIPIWAMVLSTTLLLISLILTSCGKDDDSDDSDESGSACAGETYQEPACDYISNLISALDGQCAAAYNWSFETMNECLGIIQTYLDSEGPCDKAAGECLNTMVKFGLRSIDETGNEDCGLISPIGCDDAWEEWNNCLALADSEDC